MKKNGAITGQHIDCELKKQLNEISMYDVSRYQIPAVTDFMKEVEKKKTVYTDMITL